MASRWRTDDGMAFRWRTDDGPILEAGLVGNFVIFQGILTSIAKKIYIFVNFQGVAPTTMSLSSGSAHV